jgi:hypothetical protein
MGIIFNEICILDKIEVLADKSNPKLEEIDK